MLGRPRLHLRSTDSTNERAKALAGQGAPHGTLVTTGEQTDGRGRQGRRWTAPPGSSLLMSLLLRQPPPLLSLLAAVTVCDVVGGEVRVKWPNDIVLEREGRLVKLAGILVEGRPQEDWAVLGIGVNVAVRVAELPAELHERAASLERGPETIEPLLEELLAALQSRLADPVESVLGAWRARDALRGREVRWADGVGRAEGIDAAGHLLVSGADGSLTATLRAGEVHLVAEQSRLVHGGAERDKR